jgi:hypothetical protein
MKQGESFVLFLRMFFIISSLSRLTTPINPALKPDRRGIGKKTSISSEYFQFLQAMYIHDVKMQL